MDNPKNLTTIFREYLNSVGDNNDVALPRPRDTNSETDDYHAYLLTPTGPFIYLHSPMLSNGQFEVTVEGTSGQKFSMLYSTNLVNWMALATNTLISTSTNFTDSGASQRNR